MSLHASQHLLLMIERENAVAKSMLATSAHAASLSDALSEPQMHAQPPLQLLTTASAIVQWKELQSGSF